MRYIIEIEAPDCDAVRDDLSEVFKDWKEAGRVESFRIEELYSCVHSHYCDEACSGGD